MVTPTQITTHLQTYLPIFTDKFTESLTVTSAVVDASNILTVTATAHGLSASDKIVLSEGTVRNPLSASLLVGDTVQYTTTYDHDQTRPQLPLDQQTLTFAGFTGGDTVWNGSHTIIDVTNRRNVTINLPAGETVAPTVNGSQYMIETMFVGCYTVATVPTVDTFTIDLSAQRSLPVGTVDNLSIVTGIQVFAAADFRRAQACYTAQADDTAAAFVIMTDGTVGKDPHTLNDGVATFTAQDENLLKVFRGFSIVVFLPTGVDDLSGVNAQDEAYGTLMTALYAVMFGYTVGGQIVEYKAVPVGDGPAEYNTAYYAHVYEFELPTTITYEDGFLPTDNVAFRDMALTLALLADDEAEMVVNIDLDEVEL